MTTLYLIRHGATEANLRRPYWLQGQGRDEPLAELGRRQAERVRDLFRDVPLAAVFSSPLKRAWGTAEMLVNGHGLPLRTADALKEGHVGRWEGKTYEQIQTEDAEAYRLFEEDPEALGYPEGETYHAIYQRVAPALAQIAAAHDGQAVAVVTHQIVCRVYLSRLLGMSGRSCRKLRKANGGVSVVQFHQGEPEVQTINATLHLEGVATPR